MAWSTPVTWVTGDLVTSGRLNAMIADNVNWLHGNGADGRADMRMSGSIAGYAPTTPTILGNPAYWGTVIWDATGYLASWQAQTGDAPPWSYIPLPNGMNLIVVRANTVAGGTLTNALMLQSESGEVPSQNGGTVPISGYQTSLVALHRFTGNKISAYAWHGGVGGSVQGIGLAVDVHNLVGVA